MTQIRHVTIAERLQMGLDQLGYDGFRDLQQETIEALIVEKRVLLVAPTGKKK
jgi:superfamily II DNA helicase RecQ